MMMMMEESSCVYTFRSTATVPSAKFNNKYQNNHNAWMEMNNNITACTPRYAVFSLTQF